MKIKIKELEWSKKSLIVLTVAAALVGFWLFLKVVPQKTTADFKIPEEALIIIQGNSLAARSDPSLPEPKVAKKLAVIVTAYSSTPWETDESPDVTAAGTQTRDGVIANNILPFGTKVRLPEIYGDKIFIVEDRMSWKKGNYQVDIWFPSYLEAKEFGAKRTYLEVLEG